MKLINYRRFNHNNNQKINLLIFMIIMVNVNHVIDLHKEHRTKMKILITLIMIMNH